MSRPRPAPRVDSLPRGPAHAAAAWCLILLVLLALVHHADTPASAARSPDVSREALAARLNDTARRFTDERARAVAAIVTRADAEQRQAAAREKVLRLIGGLPDARGPLAVRSSGTLTRDGFSVERIVYDSLPDFHVTANVYVPSSGPRPFPAIVLSPGHSAVGKGEYYELGANLARNGFIALAWDPIGQGERLQHFDPDLGASKVGRPTGEHGHASVQTMVIGDHLSRYFVWDAMRAIDYLETRGDVDAARIGAFGCSGGGMVTAYVTAVDPRVRAAVSACYITTFDALLPTAGPQEAEQSIPGFIAEGLDLPDWVLMAAPRPYAIVSTTEDFFPFDGARRASEEARRFYGFFGAGEQLKWFTGPGGHGALGPIMPDIVGFFVKALQGRDERPAFTRVKQEHPDDLLCTATGQVSTALGGETIRSLNRKRAAALLPAAPTVVGPTDLGRLQARLREDIRTLTGIGRAAPVSTDSVPVGEGAEREGYRLEAATVPSADGLALPAAIAVPKGEGKRKALVIVSAEPAQSATRVGSDLARLAREGTVVLLLPLRPSPPGTEEEKSPLLGSMYLLSLRALLVGETLLGMRTGDVLRAIDWLSGREDVDSESIVLYGNGAGGPVVLHAAVLDSRVAAVATDGALLSWRPIVDQPLHRGAAESVVPGALRSYDLPDLVTAIAPRPVTILNPVDAMGNPLRADAVRTMLAQVFASDEALASKGRVRVAWRGPLDPIPLP